MQPYASAILFHVEAFISFIFEVTGRAFAAQIVNIQLSWTLLLLLGNAAAHPRAQLPVNASITRNSGFNADSRPDRSDYYQASICVSVVQFQMYTTIARGQPERRE